MLVQESIRKVLPISIRVGQIAEEGQPLMPVRKTEVNKESLMTIYRGLIDETRNDFETIFDQVKQFLKNKYSVVNEEIIPDRITNGLTNFVAELNKIRKNFDIAINTFDNDINEIRDRGEESYRQDLLRNRVVRDIDSRFFGSLATLEEALNDFKYSQEQIIQIMKNADETMKGLVSVY